MVRRDRHTVAVAVFLILREDNDKILLLERKNTGWRDGWFSLPSGHLDGGESALTAMIREAKEEVDIVVEPKQLELKYVTHRAAEEADYERIDLFFETSRWSGNVKNNEPHKCAQIEWFKLDSLPKKTVPFVREVLRKLGSVENYSEFDFSETSDA